MKVDQFHTKIHFLPRFVYSRSHYLGLIIDFIELPLKVNQLSKLNYTEFLRRSFAGDKTAKMQAYVVVALIASGLLVSFR